MTKEQALAEIDASGIAARQRWQHWKGSTYTIVGTGIVEKTMDPVVMYAGADGVVWVRPLFVFTEEVAPGKPRFVRVDIIADTPITARSRGGRYL